MLDRLRQLESDLFDRWLAAATERDKIEAWVELCNVWYLMWRA